MILSEGDSKQRCYNYFLSHLSFVYQHLTSHAVVQSAVCRNASLPVSCFRNLRSEQNGRLSHWSEQLVPGDLRRPI